MNTQNSTLESLKLVVLPVVGIATWVVVAAIVISAFGQLAETHDDALARGDLGRPVAVLVRR